MACTDSDWASDNTTRRSQSGYFIKLAGGLISWTSRTQKTIDLSSTEAEYMALSNCSRQVVWMHTLLGELSYHIKPIPICRDNQGSIFIASNPITEKHSKHIDIRYHYIREVISRNLAVFTHVFRPSNWNIARNLREPFGSLPSHSRSIHDKFLAFASPQQLVPPPAVISITFFPLLDILFSHACYACFSNQVFEPLFVRSRPPTSLPSFYDVTMISYSFSWLILPRVAS